jgi:hypothetical protein
MLAHASVRRWLGFLILLTGCGALARPIPTPPLVGSARLSPAAEASERQGGDTILDAVPIIIGGTYTGTTIGYNDDYDEACPFEGSTAPDVAYSIVSDRDLWITLDLLGSDYDTKVYVYDSGLELLGCNDDFYPDYVSRLDFCAPAGETCYIVIDGYGNSSGNYVLSFLEYSARCDVVPPADAVLEDEAWPPPGSWVDCFNGGCEYLPECEGWPWQALQGDPAGQLVFAGRAGHGLTDDLIYRDADWFELEVGPGGSIVLEAEAEIMLSIGVMAPLECEQTGWVQGIYPWPCQPEVMQIDGAPGQLVWLRIRALSSLPLGCDPDVQTHDYVLRIDGLMPGTVAVERRDWSTVKGLFD